VDANDYFKIDAGFAAGASGYRNGDFDYSGRVDANDYFLIDAAFVAQGDPLGGNPAAAQKIRRLVRHHRPTRLGAKHQARISAN
jgi:hypothetical protein